MELQASEGRHVFGYGFEAGNIGLFLLVIVTRTLSESPTFSIKYTRGTIHGLFSFARAHSASEIGHGGGGGVENVFGR